MQDLLDKDLGLDLLMNPKKRSSDANSLGSSYEEDDGNMSVKSVSITPKVVDLRELPEDEDFTEDESLGSGSMRSSQQYRRAPQPPRYGFHHRQEQSGSEEEDAPSGNGSGSESGADLMPRRRMMSEEDILNAKRELLYQFDRLEKKGITMPRKFTMASNLEEMKQELDRMKRDREVDGSIKFQRKLVMTTVSGLELLNGYFNPIGARLDGWSENIHENIDDYDDVFEELHEKYKGKAKMAPELKLLFMLGGSAFMFHMTNSMFKTAAPGLDQVLKQNPELMKQFAAATANTMAEQQRQSNPMMSGLGSMIGNMFGGGNPFASLVGGFQAPAPSRADQDIAMNMAAAAAAQRPPQQRQSMRGPTNVDDILREMEADDNDRIEVLSSVTESEIADLADDASISNVLMNKKTRKPRGRNITLDI